MRNIPFAQFLELYQVPGIQLYSLQIDDRSKELMDAGANALVRDLKPYIRDIVTLGRPWAIPGTPGLEHRIGGLSKAPETGSVSYDSDHHWQMVTDRLEKVERLQEVIPPLEVFGLLTRFQVHGDRQER